MVDGFDQTRGQKVAGHRGIFLKGPGVLLNMALQNYGIQFMLQRKYTPIQPPYFMKKEIMNETCQQSDFDENLYRVETSKTPDQKDDPNVDDCFMIATSEQPISGYFRKETIMETELPIKFTGISTCFRKEAGAHGKDTWGTYRVHQFEKVEQFLITKPDQSWEMLDEMMACSEAFYQSLKIPYRVVNIVSGALNDAAAKKQDLEAWFPGYGEFRELVSCSNCTDYQSRALDVKFRRAKDEKDKKAKGGKKDDKKEDV